MREIGLTYSEAERAWWTAASHREEHNLRWWRALTSPR